MMWAIARQRVASGGSFAWAIRRTRPASVASTLRDFVASTTANEASGCRPNYSWGSCAFHCVGRQIHSHRSSVTEEQLDPFSLVESELYILASRLRSMVVAEVPKLASAAEYFFKMGVEGKRFRPTVLLLMATALNVPIPGPDSDELVDAISTELRNRQQRIAEITEMIHVASLLHDDVLDDADTRRGIGSLNFVMGNKVVSLLATVVEHLVTGETMQMTTTSEQRCSMEYYLQKTYYKTASLISNSCKAIALLAGQTAEVSMLAYEYGKNLGLAYQLIDDVLDFTGTSTSLGKGSLSDIRHALDYLGRSRGIQRTKELAAKHANLASAAIDSLPENDDEDVQRSRRALVDLTHRVVTRTK